MIKYSENRAKVFILGFSVFIGILILLFGQYYLNNKNTEPMGMPINKGLKSFNL